jgi:LacI family transcriptional regulator
LFGHSSIYRNKGPHILHNRLRKYLRPHSPPGTAMAGKRVTLKDIAKKLGLSMTTVSRSLSDHPDISGETKERVREVAQAMSYIPNYRARYLRAKHSRLIALIVPEMNMFFVPSMIAGINRVVQQNDYSLIVFQSDNSIVQERRLVEYCTHLSADGVLLVLSSETTDLQHLDVLHEFGIPVILLDKTIDTVKYTTITIDDEEAGREAATYLLDHGHTRIVGVFGDQRQRISALRLKGFRRAHAERMLPLAETQVLRITLMTELEEQLERAFAAHPDLTAIFAMTDELLVYTHYLLARRGTRVPEDVSLISISDGQAPAFLYPNVTHLRHSGGEVGERTAHILIGMIEHNSDAMMDVRIRTTLVELGSVATRTEPAKRRATRQPLREAR